MKAKFGFNHQVTSDNVGVYYVYQYVDPRNDEIFYIGKGKHRRFEFHLKENPQTSRNKLKSNRIQSIRKDGYEPIVSFIIENINEPYAYAIEEELINVIGTIKDGTGPLTNLITTKWSRSNDTYIGKDYLENLRSKAKAKWADPSSTYNSPEFRAKWKESKRGSKNSRYQDFRTFDEIHGIEKSKAIRKVLSEKRKGSGNSRAKQWILIAPDATVYEVNGELKHFCVTHNLSLPALQKFKNTVVQRPKILHTRFKEKSLNTIGWSLYDRDDWIQK